MQTNVLTEPIVLRKGENTDFPTHPVTHTTRLVIENKNLSQAGEARVKVGWLPAETIQIAPGGTMALERNWAGVVGNIFNMCRHDLEIKII
jgi:hypothetical protein